MTRFYLILSLSLSLSLLGCEARQQAPSSHLAAPATPTRTSAPPTPEPELARAPQGEHELITPPESPLVMAPQGEAPSTGFPVVVFMHGYNSTHYDFSRAAQLAASKGLVGISLPAPLPGSRPSGYQWKQHDPEHTHRYIQGVVDDVTQSVAGAQRGERVWLVGFSQGGLHASLLLAAHPEAYSGVLAISPAGWSQVPGEVTASELPREIFIVAGEQELARHKEKTARVEALMKQAGFLRESRLHAGGHHFPEDWRPSFAKIFERWAAQP